MRNVQVSYKLSSVRWCALVHRKLTTVWKNLDTALSLVMLMKQSCQTSNNISETCAAGEWVRGLMPSPHPGVNNNNSNLPALQRIGFGGSRPLLNSGSILVLASSGSIWSRGGGMHALSPSKGAARTCWMAGPIQTQVVVRSLSKQHYREIKCDCSLNEATRLLYCLKCCTNM